MKLNTKKISLIMAKQSLTAKELAVLIGITQSTLSNVRARGTCSGITAIRIASGLGVPVESIIEEK